MLLFILLNWLLGVNHVMVVELGRFTPYVLGNEAMDREHKAIYDALDAMFKNIPPEKIEDQIASALAVCNEHFHHEMELMEKFDYPFISTHKAVHSVTELAFYEFFKNPTPEKREEVIRDLLHHIDWYDRPFVQFMDGCKMPQRRATDHLYQDTRGSTKS